MKILFLSLLFLTLSHFSFAAEGQWEFYGDGIGSVTESGEISLKTDYRDSQTAFIKRPDVGPGIYQVSFLVKGVSIGKPVGGYSLWHFYDSGSGTKTVFKDFSGRFEWRKVDYTINVKGRDLTFWFRLQAPGNILVKNFSIAKVDKMAEQVNISASNELSTNTKLNRKVILAKKSLVLFNFNTSEKGHPFQVKKDTSGSGIGVFEANKYYNFDVAKMPIKDFSKFDKLVFDIYNPGKEIVPFLFAIQDDKTNDYWSALNYNSSLAPGWNHITLHLDDYLGERGSHRHYRTLNLTKLKKIFMGVDPDSKRSIKLSKGDFAIDNITLVNSIDWAVPVEMKAFDFTSIKSKPGALQAVTSDMLYDNQTGFGFIEPNFYKVEDARYTNGINRYSIGILDGQFRVNLPNGIYKFRFNFNRLGYWDVPFFKDRMVSVNGKPVFKETRSTGKEYLNDLLQFENINPTLEDNPYDLYLSKYFNGIERSVEIRNGILLFDFNGDESGVELNSLFIWNIKDDAIATKFFAILDKKNKEEFNEISRPIIKPRAKVVEDNVSIINAGLYLSPSDYQKNENKDIELISFGSDRPYQVFSLNFTHDEVVGFNWKDLVSSTGEKIEKTDFKISKIINQYVSSDLNHETYFLSGKFLRSVEDRSVRVSKNEAVYLWLQFNASSKPNPGIYKTEVSFKSQNKTFVFPLTLTILKGELPVVDFPVGFMGLDPLPFSYYNGAGYSELRKKYRSLALNKITSAGFTTFSGLAAEDLKFENAGIQFNVNELRNFLVSVGKSSIKTIFSYGGQFPNALFDISAKPENVSDDAYYKMLAKTLKPFYENKNFPKIVYMYSDEANGYSNNLKNDIEKAKMLKRYFPFMPIGGFSNFENREVNKLNELFDYGFYSSFNKENYNFLKKNQQTFGLYGASAGNLDDPRFTFGLGLFMARRAGLGYYLEWNSIGFNNYPYYDLDGRESDVALFYPGLDGKLNSSIRFELAAEGLMVYRKLVLLAGLVENGSTKNFDVSNANQFLTGLKKENYFFSSEHFLSNKDHNFLDLKNNLDNHLKKLVK